MSATSLRFALGFVAVAMASACAPRPRAITAIPDSLTGIAFNAVLAQNGSGVRVSVYCLGYAQPLATPPHWKYRDPPPNVIRQVEDSGRDVRVYSSCPVRHEMGIGRLTDTTTNGQVMVLTLQDSIQWAGDTLIVWGAYNCGGLCGGGGPVRIWRRAEKWQVLFKTEWVS